MRASLADGFWTCQAASGQCAASRVMRLIRVVKRTLLLALHILLGMLLTPLVLSSHIGGALHTNPRVTSWWHNRVADILGIGVTVSGPRPRAPALLVSNHISWLDIVVLGGLTHTDFLSKSEVRHWPVIGWLAARSGTLFIRRGKNETGAINDQIAQRLRQGGLLTLFPEGRTTRGREVRPFFPRLFAAAIDTGTDVVPVTLRYHIAGEFDPIAPYTDNQSILQNLRGLIVRDRTEVNVIFAQPIALNGHSRKEIAELAHDAVLTNLLDPEQVPLAQRVSGRLKNQTEKVE